MNCLVLGGAGFIGSHVVEALVERGHNVRVFDRARPQTGNIFGDFSKFEVAQGEFSSANDLATACSDVDVIVHLVSTTIPKSSNDDPIYDIQSNLVGTVQLLQAATRVGVKKVVFASSGGTVYGDPCFLPITEGHPTNPTCSYGITKLAIEKYLHLFYCLHGLEFVILRIANPYGERQNPLGGLGAVSTFLWKTLREEPITIWGDGTVARDYFYIADLVSAFVRVIEGESESRIYNIGGGRARTLNELVNTIHAVTGVKPNATYTAARKFDVPVNYLDISRAARDLGWKPEVSLEEGLERMWKWLCAREAKVAGVANVPPVSV